MITFSRNEFIAILLCIVAITSGGCAEINPFETPSEVIRHPLGTELIKTGMSKEEVMGIMGTKTVKAKDGYWERYSHTYHPSATNPYRTEILQGKEKTFEVLYYYTDVKKDDGSITDDELTPMVFYNGKLIGWGQGFLDVNIKKYEIRIR